MELGIENLCVDGSIPPWATKNSLGITFSKRLLAKAAVQMVVHLAYSNVQLRWILHVSWKISNPLGRDTSQSDLHTNFLRYYHEGLS